MIFIISYFLIYVVNVFSYSLINNVNLLIFGFSILVYKCKFNFLEFFYNKQYCVVKFNGS